MGDERRERAEQDKNLRKAGVMVHIREQIAKQGPIQPKQTKEPANETRR